MGIKGPGERLTEEERRQVEDGTLQFRNWWVTNADNMRFESEVLRASHEMMERHRKELEKPYLCECIRLLQEVRSRYTHKPHVFEEALEHLGYVDKDDIEDW